MVEDQGAVRELAVGLEFGQLERLLRGSASQVGRQLRREVGERVARPLVEKVDAGFPYPNPVEVVHNEDGDGFGEGC